MITYWPLRFHCPLPALLLALGLLPGRPARAQVFNGRSLQWDFSRPEEPRLKLRFGTTGSSFGSEGTAVITENLTDRKLYAELELRLRDYCGQETVRQVQVTVPAHGKVGGSTWMGGSEQFDYSSKCPTLHSYSGQFRSRIASATLTIVNVQELPTPGNGNGSGGGSGSTSGGSGSGHAGSNPPVAGGGNGPTTPAGSSPGSGSGSSSGPAPCPAFGFQLNGPVSYHCVPLLWTALPTSTLTAGPNGQVTSHSSPTYSFTVQYRVAGAPAWQSQPVAGPGIKRYHLAPLDACTRYEVRLLTHCNGQAAGSPSGSLFIDTPCQVPQQLQATDLTATTARLTTTTRFTTACGTPPQVTAAVEYKASGASAWETLYCPGGSPCRLTGLQPGTFYRVRSRYQFDGRAYSTYSNEASFRTPAPAATP